jgi:thiol-disulfide isomerase/thioredoxin
VTAQGKKTNRRGRLIAAAAIAGIVAGTAAVYVSRLGDGNVALTTADCSAALAAGKAVAPLATGEIAAFRPANRPEYLAGLAFAGPDGAPRTLADLAGRTLLVNFWATWCIPCRAEMPALSRLQGDRGGDDFEVVSINLDVGGPQRPKAFLAEIGVQNLAFNSDPRLSVMADLKRRGLAIGLPTTLLVDSQGCEIGIVEGPAEWGSAEAKALIEAAIAATASKPRAS